MPQGTRVERACPSDISDIVKPHVAAAVGRKTIAAAQYL